MCACVRVCVCVCVSAGQMIFHAHVQSACAVLMQFCIGDLGCGFGVRLSFLFCMLNQLQLCISHFLYK